MDERPKLARIRMVVDYLAYVALRIVICSIQGASIERCDRWSKILATFIYRFVGLRTALVRENLQRVFPNWGDSNIDDTTRRMWHHLFLMVCEIAHAPRKIHRTNWYDFYSFEDRQLILKTALDVRPKIMVTGHFGNFELAGFVNGLFGLPSTTLARPLDNVYIHRFITEFRSLGGQHFMSKDHSANEIQKLLETGATLGLLADQDAGRRGCWVRFLGHAASCHKALALFTLVNQAPMMVFSSRRTFRPMHFQIDIQGVMDPAIDSPQLASVQTLTQWYNDCLEAPIRSFPEQYWWLHRRWREAPTRLQKESQRMAESQARMAG